MSSDDDLPLEVRRRNWGWFGEPWPAGVCYKSDDEGRDTGEIDWDMHKETPIGEQCIACLEPFVDGDRGTAIPDWSTGAIRHWHRECALRNFFGPMSHTEDAREDALRVWQWVQEHGFPRNFPQ